MEKIDTIWNYFGQMPSVIQNYLLQALTKKQNIWFIAITIYGPVYFRKEKIFSTNLQDTNGYMRPIWGMPTE